MSEEYQTTTNLDEATGNEEVTVTSKDEPITTAVSEAGYESECSSSSRSDEDVARSALEVEADAFTRFIERQRLEVMFELRRLRLGERPVTGQDNRERIETFISQTQESQQESRIPSSRPAPPSAHIADINSLSNLRCVSAALSSAAFRQDLETTIRRTIGTRPLTPVQPVIQAPPAPQVVRPIPVQVQRPQITRTVSENLIAQRQQVNQIIPVERPQQESFHVERQEREFDSWQQITQLQRERIVVEISDLVHRQLVTSALESDFRQHLERNVLNRLERGAPQEQEQDQHPPAPRVVQPVAPLQLPRPTSRIAATNISELSSRMDAMQQMLQLVLSMQMDMQRSLRQDVASALANNNTTTMASATPPMHAGHCVVCLTALADTVLYRCGHLCVCYLCGLQLQQGTSQNAIKCPICRAPVEDILRVFKSSRDGE